MIRAALCVLLSLASLAGMAACDGGEVVVFPAAPAGSAGTDASAGVGGFASLAGAGFGGSPAAGSGGASSGAGGGGGDLVDNPCRSKDDCDPSWYCQKQDCSDAEGVCLPRPVEDDPRRAPVCGCDDKITYWNDTLRQRSGISASTVGTCMSGAKPCKSSDDCCIGIDSDDCARASCSVQLPSLSACGAPGRGQCWIIPQDCSSADDKPAGLPCPPPGQPSSTPPPCLTLCQALQARRPYSRLPSSNACP